MGKLGRMHGVDLDRTADAAIACALREDVDGLVTLISPLDEAQLRRLAGRLAVRAAEGLSGWAADAGASQEDTIAMWQHAILRAERRRTGDDPDDAPTAEPDPGP
jgi:hypothetical protein